ncbi:MAG: HAMP domain-containing histidine kinase [Chlorobi bacterium]|nr:HAMP domain-containing histidine kinase [Chlorobiota bacterium]
MDEMSDKELLNELEKRLRIKEADNRESAKLLKQLKEVNEKLNISEAMKSHFISNITNEIVNPFTSILGLSKNILAIKDNDLKKAKQMASLIFSEAFNLDFQLKNIFAAAKIEAGRFVPEFSQVDINALIKSIINDYKYKAEQKQLNIEFKITINTQIKDKLIFITDPEKLKIVLSNLINNSIKYSNATDKIKLEITGTNELLVITIRDFGKGIQEKNIKDIFNRFTKENMQINSMIRGHGLGLSVVKASLDILNGTIDVTSKPGYGSKFVISIPVPRNIDESNTFAIDSNEIFFDDEEIF